jgi:hypothetical protein
MRWMGHVACIGERYTQGLVTRSGKKKEIVSKVKVLRAEQYDITLFVRDSRTRQYYTVCKGQQNNTILHCL